VTTPTPPSAQPTDVGRQPPPPTRRPTAAQLAALAVLVAAQGKVRGDLTAAAVAAAVAAFTALTPGDWWEAKKVNAAITILLKSVQANQRQAARVTDAYIARAGGILTGKRVPTAGAVDVTKLRRAIPAQVVQDVIAGRVQPKMLLLGELDVAHRRVVPAEGMTEPMSTVVPDPGMTVSERIRRRRADLAAAQTVNPADPYGRVADQYRFQVVTQGVPEQQARQRALVRIAAVAETDVTLAVREQFRSSMFNIKDVRGWRRVLGHSKTGPCGLCVVASDRIYKIQDLKPIHDLCRCEVLPIIGDLDPGLDLSSDDLDRIYAAAGGTGGDVFKDGKRHSGALKNLRVALAEHGELGPVLVNADQHHRGVREVALTKTGDRRTLVQHQLDGWEKSFARLVRRQQAGENVDVPLAWQEKRINSLRRELASR
jgi:hypothetical protein